MLTLPVAVWIAASAPLLPTTLRVDAVHSGSASAESFVLDGVFREGPWSGHPDRALDDSGLGVYRFEVRDARTGRRLFTRGFASVFGEWRTTAEARSTSRSFHESFRFPTPSSACDLVVEGRVAGDTWTPLWRTRVDPNDPAIEPAASTGVHVTTLRQSGPPQEKLDLAILGDGYTEGELPKLREDARRLTDVLLSLSPFRERSDDLNLWVVETPAASSGISRPQDGIVRDSPLGTTYDTFGMERYVLTFENRRLRDSAAAVPYDALVILLNERHYGGGGIFGLYATCAAGSRYAPYVFVHELGHVLGGLADEYYLSSVSYESDGERPEPWEPNVTADPRAARWADLITVGTPLPTPWPKGPYEALVSDMRARREALRKAGGTDHDIEVLFRTEQERTHRLLAAAQYAGRVGAFEGAMYAAHGYFRPAVDCIMFSRTVAGFCPVCRRALEDAIDRCSRPPRRGQAREHGAECPSPGAGVE